MTAPAQQLLRQLFQQVPRLMREHIMPCIHAPDGAVNRLVVVIRQGDRHIQGVTEEIDCALRCCFGK